MGKVRKAVIPAAGLGTRSLPATKVIPKEMLAVVDTPIIQLVVAECVRAGITDIVIVNGRHKSAIEDHFDHAVELEATLRERGKDELLARVADLPTMANIISVRQKQPLGLGHAVLCARPVVGDEPFAVLLPDDLILSEQPAIGQLCDLYAQTGSAALSLMEVPKGQEQLYGIASGEPVTEGPLAGTFAIRDLVEKPAPGTAPSQNAVIGRYVLPPAVWDLLENTPRGAIGEIQLTDALRGLAGAEPGIAGVPLPGPRYDAGNQVGYVLANLAFGLARDDIGPAIREQALALLSGAE